MKYRSSLLLLPLACCVIVPFFLNLSCSTTTSHENAPSAQPPHSDEPNQPTSPAPEPTQENEKQPHLSDEPNQPTSPAPEPTQEKENSLPKPKPISSDPIIRVQQDVDGYLVSLQKHPPSTRVVGLKNCGNTCYLNSLLQILMHTDYLQRYMTFRDFTFPVHTNKTNEIENAEKLTIAFQRLAARYLSTPATQTFIDTSDFVTIRDEVFGELYPAGRQEDAAEFYNHLIDNFHIATNKLTEKYPYKQLSDEEQADLNHVKYYDIRANGHSFVSRLTRWYSKTTIECSNSLTPKVSYEPANTLILPMPKTKISLETSIANYQNWQDSDYLCSDGSKAKQQKTEIASLAQAPAYMAIQLKRFIPVDMFGTVTKNTEPINFPKSLTIAGKTLHLYGVILHRGSLGKGHYTSYILPNGGSWHYCDDETVTTATEEQVLRDTRRAYLLFYQAI